MLEAMMDWYDHAGWGWGGWLLMSMLMIVFWAAVVAGAYAFIRSTRRGEAETSPRRALDILDERLARGDIDADEYTARRDELRTR